MDTTLYLRITPQNIFIIFHELELLFMNFSLNLNLNSLLELHLDSVAEPT
jgi:hypothetical protein